MVEKRDGQCAHLRGGGVHICGGGTHPTAEGVLRGGEEVERRAAPAVHLREILLITRPA